METDEPMPHPRNARNLWIGLVAPLLVAVLLLDLPLALLYGLRAELRHLSHKIPGTSADIISLAYSTDTMLPALAINTGPEDALSSRPADVPKCHACTAEFVGSALMAMRVGYASNALVYGSGAFIPSPPRSYDPLGPPSAYL